MKIASLIAGFLAVALYLLCFQLKSAKKIIACRILSSAMYVLQYLLLFAFVGAAMDAAALLTNYIAYKKDTKFISRYKIPVLVCTNLGIIAVGLLLSENLFGLLAIAGVMLETASSWMKKERMIRIVSLFAVPCWLTYNLVCGAYAAAVGSVLAFVSIISALIRYRNSEKDPVLEDLDDELE